MSKLPFLSSYHLGWSVAMVLAAGAAMLLGEVAKEQPFAEHQESLTERLHEASRADYALAARRMDVDGKWQDGVALLTQALHRWPENPQAATRLWATLSLHAPEQQCWPRLILRGDVDNGDGAAAGDGDKSKSNAESWVWSAQFSRDGKHILTMGDDGAQVWDAATGRPVGRPIEELDSESPPSFSADGSRMVNTYRSHRLCVLDVATGEQIGEAMVHEGVNGAWFSRDGTRIVSTSDDFSVQVWDVATQKPVGERLKHEGLVKDADFSVNGELLVTASEDRMMRVWNVETGKLVGQPLHHAYAVRHVEFSPLEWNILATCADGSSRVWDMQRRKFLGRPMRHLDAVVESHFSPTGALVVTASQDCTAQVWSASTGRPHGGPMRHEHAVVSAKFSADGRYVVTTDASGTARVWETTPERGDASGGSFYQQDEDDTPLTTNALDAKGRSTHWQDIRLMSADMAAAGGIGGLLRKPLGAPLVCGEGLQDAVFSPDGTRVLTVCRNSPPMVWDAPTGMAAGEPLRLEGGGWYGGGMKRGATRNEGVVTDVVMSPDGRRLVMMNNRSWSAQMRDLMTGREVSEGVKGLPTGAACGTVRFSHDGRLVVASGLLPGRGSTVVQDVVTGRAVCSIGGHRGLVLDMDFSPDDKRLLTAGADGMARVWSVESGQPMSEPMLHERSVLCAEYSRDGRLIVTGSADGTARVWNAVKGGRLMLSLMHVEPGAVNTKKRVEVHSAHFSADGARIVTACSDGAARVWDAKTGQPVGAVMKRRMSKPLRVGDEELLRRPWHPAAGVLSAVFSPDGKRVLTALSDDTAQVWDAESGKPVGAPLGVPELESTSDSCAVYSPDGAYILTAHLDGKARLWDATTGLPLGEPMDHGQSGPDAGTYRRVPNACFSVDGSCIVTSGIDEVARVWPVPPPVVRLVPVPEWVLRRACAVAGMERGLDGGLQPLGPEARRAEVMAAVPKDSGTGAWGRLARWLAQPALERTLTPESKFTRRQVAERERDSCVWFNDFPILSEVALESALRHDPTMPLAHIMLAGAVYSHGEMRSQDVRADVLHRYGLQFLPEDATLWSQAARIIRDHGDETLALQAAKKALKLDPGSKMALEVKVELEDSSKRQK